MTRAVSAVLPATPRLASNKELDASALQAIAQAAVNVELFTIPLYMGTLYSIQGTHQITGKNDFYKDRLWPGPAPTAPRPGDTLTANEKAFNIIFSVFIEEMLHLQLASHLAGAVGINPVFDSPALQDSRGGWTCYGSKKTVIPHIVDLRDTKTYDKVKVDIAAISADQMKLFIAIEQPETDAQDDLKPLADRPSGNEYFPTVPFDDWTTHSTEEDLPMFGTIGAMYQCYLDYMAITYDDDTTLWDYVFFANQRDLFNVQAKGHPKREYPGFDATLGAAGFKQAMGMMDAITDQGEGSLLVRPPPRADALRVVEQKYQASLEALEADYPSFTDTGEDAPSAAAAARSERGGVDHYERFRELRDELLPEVVTWKDWFADHGPWTARDLRTTDNEPGTQYKLPTTEAVAAALVAMATGDQRAASSKLFSTIACGSIAGITTVLNTYFKVPGEPFPYPSMVGAGDRMAICWAVLGEAPNLAIGVDPPDNTTLYHCCQGLDLTDVGVDCAAPKIFHACRGSNLCKAQGGCGFVQKTTRWWALRVPAGRHQGGRRRRRGRLLRPQRQQVRRLRGLCGSDLGVPDLPRRRHHAAVRLRQVGPLRPRGDGPARRATSLRQGRERPRRRLQGLPGSHGQARRRRGRGADAAARATEAQHAAPGVPSVDVNALGLPELGDGVGLREVHFRHLLATPPHKWGVDWFEVISENFMDDHGFAAHVLEHVAAHRPVVMHGVSLSIGSTDPLDLEYLGQLRSLAERLRPAWVSDHLCWTGVNGVVSHDLLPLPFTQHSLDHVAERVLAVQDFLGPPARPGEPEHLPGVPVVRHPRVGVPGHAGRPDRLRAAPRRQQRVRRRLQPRVRRRGVRRGTPRRQHRPGPPGRRHRPRQPPPRHPRRSRPGRGVAPVRPGRGAHRGRVHPARMGRRHPAVPRPGRRAGQGPGRAGRWRPGRDQAASAGGGLRVTGGPVTGGPVTDLDVLQRWVLAACTGTGPDRNAAAEVKETEPLSAQQRLDIYARGYLSRLVECLRNEFGALRALAGDEVFDLFAKGYVWSRPPTSPSMFDLGAGFADYLEDTRPQPVGPPASPDAAPAALARLERARLEAGRAPGVETDPDHTLVDPVVVMTNPGLTVRTPASLRLLRSEFALADVLAAADRGNPPPEPLASPTDYTVARSHYRVVVHVLAPWQHAVLAACGTAGTSLDRAVAASADTTDLCADEVWTSVFAWLPRAVQAGMATAVL